MPSSRLGPALQVVVAVVLLIGLIVAALPDFDGGVEGQYFNESLKGFSIPADYQVVQSYLASHPGSVLVMPGDAVYIMTTWGYQGTTYFYKAYFAPIKVYTIDDFGGGYGSANSIQVYKNLTQPAILPSGSNGSYEVSPDWKGDAERFGITYVLLDASVTQGNFTSYSYCQASISALVSEGVVTQVYRGQDVGLYRLTP